MLPADMPNPYGLSPTALALAFFITLTSETHSLFGTAGLSDFRALFNVTENELNRAQSDLIAAKILLSSGYGYNKELNINHDYSLRLAHLLVTQYPAITKKLLNVFSRWIGPCRLITLMQWAAGNDSLQKEARDAYITEGLMTRICALDMTEDWMLRLVTLCSWVDVRKLVLDQVHAAEFGYGDTKARELINKLIRIGDLDASKVRSLNDAISYLDYICHGIVPEIPVSGKIPSSRPYLLCCAGIVACYKGNFSLAIDYLTKATKSIKAQGVFMNTPPLLFPSYFLVVAYNHSFMRQALYDLAVRTTSRTFLPCTVVASGSVSDVSRPSPAIMEALKSQPEPSLQAFYALFAKYYLNVSSPANLLEVPDVDILRSELRDIIPLTPQQKKHVETCFGPEAVLYSHKILPLWEKKVNEIMADLDQAISDENKKEQKSEASSEQYVYVVSYSDKVSAMKQTKLKSGNWSVFKNVSIKTFADCFDKLTDPYDRAMAALAAKRLSNTSVYFFSDLWPHMCAAIPLLVGCDRVYVSTRLGYEQATVTEEKVMVRIEEKKGKLEVSANVPLNELASADQNIIRYDSMKQEYTVMKINPRFVDVLTKLLHVKSFPLEAKDSITVLLAKMSDYVDVESPLLSSDAIPAFNGDTTVIVQLQPASATNYNAVMFVRPYPESRHKHIPGKGKEQYIALYQGKSARITRDLAAESRAMDAISEALTDTNADIDFAESTASLDIDSVLTLLDWAKANPDKVAIEWPEKNGIRLQRIAPGSWNVSLNSNSGWFDIEGDVKLDDATVISMTALLQSIGQAKGRYIRLDDGKFLEIDKKLRTQLARLESLSVKNHSKMQISQFNAAMLPQSLTEGEMKVRFDDKLVKLQNRVEVASKYEPQIPSTLTATLRPYQEDGFRWMARLASWGAGACLADDMGLGKTVQTIAFLLLKADEGPALVVAPASVVPNWANELERFAPTLNPKIVNKAEDRAATIREAKAYDVVLITYGLLSNELEALTSQNWSTICLDEAHTIKNRETKMSQAAMALKADYRIILTGTPLQNNLGELWNLFRFINPGLLGSFDSFREKFVRPITEEGDRQRRHALQRIIKPFMLRRTKADVASDLPEKTEVYIPIELTSEEMALYEAMRQKAANAIEGMSKVDVSTLAEISRLRRAACAMSLVDPDWKGANSKVQAFLDLVQDCQGADNNMLVFSQYTSFLDIVRSALDKAQIPYLYLDGATTMAKREKLVAEFNQGKTPLFLISLKAGGLGLNLPAANYVVHLDPWWNPAIEQQATDRAYRIGQKRKVMVYHMLSKGTIEEKIRRLHATKRDLADSLLEGSDMAASLTMKDILDLISTR